QHRGLGLRFIHAGKKQVGVAVVLIQRAFDERSDIFYYRVIQSINNALAAHEVQQPARPACRSGAFAGN
ncbi:hypothetical protein DD568_28300, partial [Klebsiella pneumoniae]